MLRWAIAAVARKSIPGRSGGQSEWLRFAAGDGTQTVLGRWGDGQVPGKLTEGQKGRRAGGRAVQERPRASRV